MVSGRLIYADKLITDLKEYVENIKNFRDDGKCFLTDENVLSIIEEQPTTFDVDKVVNEMKALQNIAQLERKTIANEEVEELCDVDDWYDSGYTTGYLNAQINTYQKAIDIVRKGGRDITNWCVDCPQATYSRQGRPYCKKEERHLDSFGYKPNWCPLKAGECQ